MTNFVESNKRKGRAAFKKLSEDQNWFKNLEFSEDLTAEIDGIATSKTGRTIYVEVKTRGGKYEDFFKFIENYDTIFLDYGKLDAVSNELMKDKAHGKESGAIFVSVFNDGEIILIHNLLKIFPTKHLGLQHVTNFAKKEEGKKEDEYELKTGLPWRYATFYRRNSQGNYYKWEWDSIDYWDIMPLVKVDMDEISDTLSQIIFCSRLNNSHPTKRKIAETLQGNADIINEYMNINLDIE
jgi:hypothetical protein